MGPDSRTRYLCRVAIDSNLRLITGNSNEVDGNSRVTPCSKVIDAIQSNIAPSLSNMASANETIVSQADLRVAVSVTLHQRFATHDTRSHVIQISKNGVTRDSL